MEAGLIFLSFFLFGDNASFRKCPAEHKPHQRPRNNKLEGQCHDKFFGILVTQIRSNMLHCPVCTQASVAP